MQQLLPQHIRLLLQLCLQMLLLLPTWAVSR
jgi:hypothetical protein